MSVRTWKPHPVHVAIVEFLQRKKGALTDVELFDLLRERYGDVGYSFFNRTLMCLEIEGRVHVSSLTRGKRRVELVEKKE